MSGYKLYATAKKTAKENNLVQAYGRNTYNYDYVYYDLSIFDDLDLPEEEKQMIIDELIGYHAITWYEQPLPILAFNNLIAFNGQIKTHATRIYNAKGKRTMVIVKVTGYHIEKRQKHDYWDDGWSDYMGAWDKIIYDYEKREEIEMK